MYKSDIESLLGKTLTGVIGDKYAEQLVFVTEDGEQYYMEHRQDCCESVYIEDIVGDLQDLVGEPITAAREEQGGSEHGWPGKGDGNREPESYTWTFYILGTRKGSVTIRWFGSSSGYYGESASVYKAGA